MERLGLLLLCAITACGSDTFTGADGSASDGGSEAASEDAGPCAKTPSVGSVCEPGKCYCATSPATCYPGSMATTCCGQSVECATDAGGNPDAGQCMFKHPLLDAGARFCGPGDCYCKWDTGESCYPAGSSTACCPSKSFTCY